ncbi:MAG: hypothetical protein GY757_38420, partial [bacterium]|nr:hypothetical protein [bacterium]
FPNLKSVYIGDMNYEECEISWIQQSDMTPLLEAYPGLEELRIKGSEGLQFSKLNHGALKSIIIECGGLGKDVLKTIAGATLPALEHLELYLGVEHYGFDGGLEDILPFLKKDLFPKLKVLGLRDSEIADDIAKAAAGADVLDQIEVLDLSLGTLSDKGAEAFLSSEKIKKLKKLDLHYHYMSDDMIKKLRKLGITIDAGDPQGSETHEDDRYPNVTE